MNITRARSLSISSGKLGHVKTLAAVSSTFAEVSSNFCRGLLKHLPWCLQTFARVYSCRCNGRRFCLVVKTMADSFPEFDDTEIQ